MFMISHMRSAVSEEIHYKQFRSAILTTSLHLFMLRSDKCKRQQAAHASTICRRHVLLLSLTHDAVRSRTNRFMRRRAATPAPLAVADCRPEGCPCTSRADRDITRDPWRPDIERKSAHRYAPLSPIESDFLSEVVRQRAIETNHPISGLALRCGSPTHIFRCRACFHSPSQTERPHIGPDFFNVLQAVRFAALLSYCTPARRHILLHWPDRVLFFSIDHNEIGS
jgi:hypothetical protein